MRRGLKLTGIAMAAVVVLTGCSGGGSGDGDGGDAGAPQSLVIDASFALSTADPGRMYEDTGSMIVHAMYETLLTFDGSDVTAPTDGLASYEMSEDSTTLTLTMKDGAEFSDGSPITADDALFSLNRVKGIQGNPSFLLDGVTIEKVDDSTLVLTSDEPNPALPFILPNPALSVINQEAVEAQGGTLDDTDAAEPFLNSESAGSGPYILESFDPEKQVVLSVNENYQGETPAYERVVIRNVVGATQQLNIQKGDSQIALNLNPSQIADLAGSDVNVFGLTSQFMVFLFMNQNPEISAITTDQNFVKAVKHAIDYDAVARLAGEGAVHPGGVVPTIFSGSLGTSGGLAFDQEAARDFLAQSSYGGEEVILNYANDHTLLGLSFQDFAELIQAQLAEVGINMKLGPAPIGSELDRFRNGQEEMGMWYWGPDFPDASNYLVFNAGELVGLRAGWSEDASGVIAPAAETAKLAGSDDREAAFQDWQQKLNESGPFVPLMQPAQNIATGSQISSITTNPTWTLDIASVK